jgi:hypothetical protein
MVNIKPTFFIVGAQRCGTTALSKYLRSHPNICFSRPKEPHFFAKEFQNVAKIRSIEEYLALFKECVGTEFVIGEGSTGYLQSANAISNIYKFNSAAKIIAMLRNPVDIIYSLHAHLFYTGHEDENDFEKAWRLQNLRSRGKKLPNNPVLHPVLQYKKVGKIGFQVKRLLSVFPTEQVKIILFDDFKTSPRKIYEEVLSFLEVPTDGRKEFPVSNENKIHRFPMVIKYLRKTVPWELRSSINETAKKYRLQKFLMHRVLTTSAKRKPLSANFRMELVDEFRDDIEQLSRILDRDLEHWLQ